MIRRFTFITKKEDKISLLKTKYNLRIFRQARNDKKIKIGSLLKSVFLRQEMIRRFDFLEQKKSKMDTLLLSTRRKFRESEVD